MNSILAIPSRGKYWFLSTVIGRKQVHWNNIVQVITIGRYCKRRRDTITYEALNS
uniref:Uncharacterized protein n=1 Tax=Octopus bimaculoides TaxID=37653 RepID=A0A0L8H1N4_OCTBM